MKDLLSVLREHEIILPDHLQFRQISQPGLCRISDTAIEYSSKREALRGISLYLAGERGEFHCEFKTLGVMYDCSRNGVPRVDWLKRQFVSLALLGYDLFQLYMEDVYPCEGEPLSGYGRGAYSAEELKELDDFAHVLGIELCTAIQCLGHLEHVLKFGAYGKVSDTSRILLADEEATYDLIEKMIASQSMNFRSRRINLGFDEAVGLARGKFLEKHGLQNVYDVFLRHLARVLEICKKYDMKPMIWSDMFFRVHHPEHLYYVSELNVTEEMRSKIPSGVQLVFWDYYHWEEPYYLDMIRIHRDFGFEPVMASMVWTPARLWYDHQQSAKTIPPCINASKQAGLNELIFTLWGDDGAYCDFDSALAGLTFAAAEVWKCTRSAAEQYRICFRGDYEKVLLAANMTIPQPEQFTAGHAASDVLWDDPILGIGYRSTIKRYPECLQMMRERCQEIAEQLLDAIPGDGGDLAHACLLAKLIDRKIALRQRMEEKIYDAQTREMALTATALTDQVLQSFRRQWLRRNKPFGLHLIQARLAGLAVRFREIAQRIDENSSFPELDLPIPEKGLPGGGTWHNVNLIPNI